MDILWSLSLWDFNYNLYLPAHRLLYSQSPYQSGVWFPMVIGAFNPLGWLDIHAASLVWLVLTLILIGVIAWMIGARSPIAFGLAFGAIILFPQTLTHLLLGQFDLLAIVLFLAAVHFVARKQIAVAAFVSALALSKPQLGIFVIPGLLILSYRVGGYRAALRFAGGLVGSALVLTLPLWVMYPTWLSDFMAMQAGKPDWLQPNLFILLRVWFGPAGLALWLALFVAAFAANAWLWLKAPARVAVLWSLALTVLISPYIWTWDFVLVLPLFLFLVMRATPRVRLYLASGYVALWLLNWWIRFSVDGGEERFWIIPLLLVGTILISYLSPELHLVVIHEDKRTVHIASRKSQNGVEVIRPAVIRDVR